MFRLFITRKASKASDLSSLIAKDEVQPTKSPSCLVCAPRGFHIRNVKCSRPGGGDTMRLILGAAGAGTDRGAKAKL